jgi:transcriptional regulator GlxA family with amidase domain
VARRNVQVRRSSADSRRDGLPPNSYPSGGDAPLTSWSQPLRVGFILTNEFTLSAFANFIDVLRLASEEWGDSPRDLCQWHVMASSTSPIKASCGLTISPTCGLLDPDGLDYIVVVGGLLHRGTPLDRRTQAYLTSAARSSVKLVGASTGSFVLCRLGLLQGKKCCISWGLYHDFLQEFDKEVPVADQLYVIDGDRLTCPGGLGCTHLAADLVRRHLGASTAQKVLRALMIDQPKQGSSAQPSPVMEFVQGNVPVSRALLCMEQNIARPISVPEIAARQGISTRHLDRLFRQAVGNAPHATYLKLRLKHARWMLGSDLSLACIAAETGFSDSAHLGKAFRKEFSRNPSEERRLRAP